VLALVRAKALAVALAVVLAVVLAMARSMVRHCRSLQITADLHPKIRKF